MTPDPIEERTRVHEKYPALSRRDLAIYIVFFATLIVACRFLSIDWYFFAGLSLGLLGWEFTKYRLRRNSDQFAGPLERGQQEG